MPLLLHIDKNPLNIYMASSKSPENPLHSSKQKKFGSSRSVEAPKKTETSKKKTRLQRKIEKRTVDKLFAASKDTEGKRLTKRIKKIPETIVPDYKGCIVRQLQDLKQTEKTNGGLSENALRMRKNLKQILRWQNGQE